MGSGEWGRQRGDIVALYPEGISANSRWSAQRHHRIICDAMIPIPKGLQPHVNPSNAPRNRSPREEPPEVLPIDGWL